MRRSSSRSVERSGLMIDVLGVALEHVVLDRVELVADLVEDREAVVEQVVEHVVEQVARALREELVAQRLLLLAAPEEPRDREQLGARHRDQVVLADEEVELGRVQALDGLVVDGEMEDCEQVALLGVLVDLRPLALREHVLDVERVPAEAVGEAGCLVARRRVDVNPGQAVRALFCDPRLRPRKDLPAGRRWPLALDAWQAWHGY